MHLVLAGAKVDGDPAVPPPLVYFSPWKSHVKAKAPGGGLGLTILDRVEKGGRGASVQRSAKRPKEKQVPLGREYCGHPFFRMPTSLRTELGSQAGSVRPPGG